MQTDDVTIRAQVQDGVWETFGADRAINVLPESLIASINEAGSDKASFDLRRSPSALWPDLQAFTPIEIEVAGEPIWSGRIGETPATDGDDPIINVQCEGWQYHLDDDSYAKNYVHTDLSAWRDARTFPDVALGSGGAGQFAAVAQVASDNGSIQIAYPSGQTVTAGTYAGVILDLGPNNTAASISIDYETSNNSSSIDLCARGGTSAAALQVVADDAIAPVASTVLGASGSIRGVFPTPARFVFILWYWGAATSAPAADVWIKIKGLRVFGNDSYRSTDASILTATTVINDALSQAAPLLASDRSQIATTSFPIPDLHFERDPKTTREVLDASNAFHNYNMWLDVDRRLNFQPRPSSAIYEVGAWGGSQFQDSAMNSGQDVYNRVLVTGTGPDGAPLIVSRTAAQQAGVPLTAQSLVRVANPSFVTDAANWTNTTRDTVTFDTAPASGAVDPGNLAVGTLLGTFRRNITYVLRMNVLFTVARTITFGVTGDNQVLSPSTSPGFQSITMIWTPKADTSAATIRVDNTLAFGPTATLNIDSMVIVTAAPTIVDRRGFQRTKTLPIGAALTPAVGAQIGDVWLQTHATQPLKGALTVQSGGIKRHQTGEFVHPAHILRSPGQNVRLSHRIDPDTGGHGRDGRIAAATYTHAERSTQIELDNDRRSFEALVSRYSAIVGTRVRS